MVSAIGLLALLLVCVGGAVVIFVAAAGTGAAGAPAQNAGASWVPTWSDEFDGAYGSAPDPKKWTAESGGGGWGNRELEYYTARRTNTRVEKGNLVIEARQEKFTGADGVSREYTSARLKTEKLFAQKYGKFEARIRIPKGQGMWPAFWMLAMTSLLWAGRRAGNRHHGKHRARAKESSRNHSWPRYSGDDSLGAPYELPQRQLCR